MARSTPYQPFLLRVLHGISGFLAIAAIVTGFWVYSTYDGRFGKLALPKLGDIQGIHGTLALFFLIILPFFAIYSFHAGARRLIQPNTVQQLGQIGKPIWWITLHRIANTLMLLAATLAVVTGRMMKEAWLPAGELNHVWYLAHLVGWLVMVVALLLHLLMSAKVGGLPLLLSMLRVYYRPDDSPVHWPERMQAWWSTLRKPEA